MSAHNNWYTHTPGQDGPGGRVHTKSWSQLVPNDQRDLVGYSVLISNAAPAYRGKTGHVLSHSVGGAYWIKLTPTLREGPTVEVERAYIAMVFA